MITIQNSYRFGAPAGGVEFITEWTVNASDNLTLPLDLGYTYNFTVNYGDGTGDLSVTAYNDSNATHLYTSGGVYDVTITGEVGSWKVNNDNTIEQKITEVKQWGVNEWVALNFEGCKF